ncbi:DciA family protein [Streptomyces globisporus]
MNETTASGADLARIALQTARAAAKSAPQPKRTRTATTRTQRSGGREPLPFADALARMVAERGWATPAAAAATAGSVIDQWPAIAPELAGKVEAVRYDATTGTLHLRPATPAYRTQLTLHQKQITTKLNAVVGPDTVRSWRSCGPPHSLHPTPPLPRPAMLGHLRPLTRRNLLPCPGSLRGKRHRRGTVRPSPPTVPPGPGSSTPAPRSAPRAGRVLRRRPPGPRRAPRERSRPAAGTPQRRISGTGPASPCR